eukprot:320977-Chlamydomonas_euryale.AAC.4
MCERSRWWCAPLDGTRLLGGEASGVTGKISTLDVRPAPGSRSGGDGTSGVADDGCHGRAAAPAAVPATAAAAAGC